MHWGYGDPDWIGSSAHIRPCPLPEVPQDRTLRFFQIEGDSMLPSAQRHMDSMLHSWNALKTWEAVGPMWSPPKKMAWCLNASKTDLMTEGDLLLTSNNPLFAPFSLDPRNT